MAGSHVAIIGSGFAGTILARLLTRTGRDVVLVERGRHPRFALGESSTPLAAICLERLATTYGLSDLADLAAYGRWTRGLPELRRGLKRGFTFYAHTAGQRLDRDADKERRLAVAASPSDEVADAHWMRSDVDAALVERAVLEGVTYIDGCELAAVEGSPGGWRLTGERAGGRIELRTEFIVDATGAAAFLSGQPGFEAAGPAEPIGPRTGLLFGHFEGVRRLEHVMAAAPGPAPYPIELAAVHHLLDEGWMYALRFDDGVVSAGAVIDHTHPDSAGLLSAPPAAAWERLIAGYPTLRAQFGEARALRPIECRQRLQYRARAAAGPGWASLPSTYCFISPMFSTGIAWSLVAVERLAALLGAADASAKPPDTASYAALLSTEARWIADLVEPAYELRDRFGEFSAWAQTYFAAASFWEVAQRLCPAPAPSGWASVGFLGATDPVVRAAARSALREIRGHDGRVTDGLVAPALSPRNLAGLADDDRSRAYPVDLAVLVERAGLLGLEPNAVAAALPRLRGSSAP